MEVTQYHIPGLFSFVPARFTDARGEFFESFNQALFEQMAGRKINFVQDNQSSSNKGVVRGLHFQAPPHAQGKLVRVIRGSVIDVAVDIRSGSPTYGQHVSLLLSAENNRVFWIPEGFAHGFSVLQDDTVFFYKCTAYYNKQSEGCLLWDDPDLGIDWQVEGEPLLSEKDREGSLLKNFITPF